MAIIGVGVDLASVDRIKKTYSQFGDKFLTRILHSSEISELPNDSDKLVVELTKKWACKEAAMKSLGQGLGQGLLMSDLILSRLSTGAPQIKINGRPEIKCHISVSDEGDTVAAFVMAEGIS